MARFLVLLASLVSTFALNIVANGPTLKKHKAMGASTIQMPKDHLAEVRSKQLEPCSHLALL